MTDDILTTCLINLCKRFDSDPLRGRYAVAKRTGLSEQYLYQIIARKPLTSGKLRSVGAQARQRISTAFPDWLESFDKPVDALAVRQPDVLPYAHPHPIIRQVIALMEATDDAGKGIVMMAASQALEKYRPITQTAA